MEALNDRVISTPSQFAKEHLFYVQEAGTLCQGDAHISQRLSLDSYLFFLVLGGKGEFHYQNRQYYIRQGDCVWIDCSYPYSHISTASSSWELKWVHFYGKKVHTFYKYFVDQGKPAVFSPFYAGSFNESLSALYGLHKNNDSMKELLSHKYLTDIITSCFTENTHAGPKESETFEKLIQIQNHIRQDFSSAMSLDTLSDAFYISKYHLAREYKKQFGTTLFNDLTNYRISHSKSLLRFTSQSIKQIAMECGYSDVNYFIKVFKKMENMTPLEYRRKW